MPFPCKYLHLCLSENELNINLHFMKRFLRIQLAMLVALAFTMAACSEDEEPAPTAPDISGTWAMTASTLVEPSPMTVKNVPTPAGPMDVTWNAGDDVLALTGSALAAYGCADPAQYSTFVLELTASPANEIYFNCVGEGNRFSVGSYTLRDTDGDGVFTELGLNIQLPDVAIPINLTMPDAQITDTKISGSIPGYPMKKDASLDLDDPSGNLQLITTTIEFTKVQ